ncbi:glycosyltransferase family 2 protein [Sporomusa acidovorans]|uniref:Glycosyltransferase 2-like domain-containing protein n=1 Tax=Sporomusa acidovorans (strain ATCC 49682 / DSM 3132 / Mol) TaxID=1123286 RepID=A0ABZ3J9C1_SPOA4|nr:glycosyltransferase family 2 protein [Sporomusa acidovorans]OZC15160.1 SPBc2 prophage-derived glycosyltransferase SunS [Sporomusa acidovorans DSM 3132]SDF43597.1 Glycosyl transferase family 2 [Sporomusa acidovorans]
MEKGWSLTVCLIVKNEEHCLGDCLDSIKDWADQIVVVDTGSTDNTLEVARQYHVQIEYFTWENDFAKARNYSLQFAVGDWILILDADERIEGSLATLPDLVTKDYEGYYVTIKSPLGAGAVEAEDHVVRLFRNGRGYKFNGAIHEQIAGSIKEGKGQAAIGFSGIIVRHRGYEPEEILRKQKTVRNSQIIQSRLAECQDDTFMLYSLGTELIQQEQYGEACDLLKKALQHMTGKEGYFREVIVLALMASLKSAYADNEDLFAKALAMMPTDNDLLFLAGLRQALMGNCTFAAEMLVKGGINTVLAPPQLLFAIAGELFYIQKNWQEAYRYFKLSLKAAPSLYSAVRMIEVISQGETKSFTELADAIGGDFVRLVQEAIRQDDYYAAAIFCLAVIDKDSSKNISQWKSLYQSAIKQAGNIPAVIKDYLGILCQQIEICNVVLGGDKNCRIAQNYRAKAVNRSLRIWLTMWPEHVLSKSIWECCL